MKWHYFFLQCNRISQIRNAVYICSLISCFSMFYHGKVGLFFTLFLPFSFLVNGLVESDSLIENKVWFNFDGRRKEYLDQNWVLENKRMLIKKKMYDNIIKKIISYFKHPPLIIDLYNYKISCIYNCRSKW